MSTGVLLITHPGVGRSLLDTACATYRSCPVRARCIEVPPDSDTTLVLERARQEIESIDDGSGVLVLTDAFGATPSNIACDLLCAGRVNVISGVNLPMLIRVFNYADENLEGLTEKAAEGGMRGIRVSRREENGQS